MVRGGPETSVASEHTLGPFTLIDTPGFQSGRESHDEAAVRAARDAAVLVVVLNINLLIGDTAMLAELLRGSARIAGKRSRCLFVIGRVDGLGVDPEADPRDFLNRCRRKEAELVSALAAQGIDVHPDQVYSVAADPFGLVGDRIDITASSYRDRHRVWDGIRPLLDPLLAVGGDAAEGSRCMPRSTWPSPRSVLSASRAIPASGRGGRDHGNDVARRLHRDCAVGSSSNCAARSRRGQIW